MYWLPFFYCTLFVPLQPKAFGRWRRASFASHKLRRFSILDVDIEPSEPRARVSSPRTTRRVQRAGGGFVIPAGVTKPNKRVPPPHAAHTAGVKRSAGDAFTSGQVMVTPTARVGERATMDRTLLREVEVGSNGDVLKRVRR